MNYHGAIGGLVITGRAHCLSLLPFIVYMVNEMVIKNGWLSETDILFQKSLRYSHHKENYLRSLQEGIPPVGKNRRF